MGVYLEYVNKPPRSTLPDQEVTGVHEAVGEQHPDAGQVLADDRDLRFVPTAFWINQMLCHRFHILVEARLRLAMLQSFQETELVC